MLRTAFVASCLAILPQAGWAADSGSSTETEDWSGFYVGANAGFVWGNGDIIVPEYDPPANAIRFNGPRAGLFSGFSWQPQDRVVFGLELGANWLDGNGDTALTRTGEQFTVSQDWELSAVARLGTPVASHLVYGLAGASWTRFAGAFPDQPATSDWVAGWTVGAGVEHCLLAPPARSARISLCRLWRCRFYLRGVRSGARRPRHPFHFRRRAVELVRRWQRPAEGRAAPVR